MSPETNPVRNTIHGIDGHLQHVGNIHRHLVDLSGVVLLDVAKDANIVRLDEVDRHTLAPEAT